MTDGILLAVYVLAAVFSAFFSGSETAITSLSDAQVLRLKEEGHSAAACLARLRADLGSTLSTLLVGNTLANIAAGSLGTAVAIDLFGERWGVLTSTIATTLLLLIVAEVTPKTLAARRPEEFASFVARPLELVVGALSPLTRLLAAISRVLLRPFGASEHGAPDVTEADVKSLISLGHQQGTLEREEKDILHAVLEFGEMPLRESIVPRSKVVSLPVDASFESVESVCREHRYSRYPVWRGGPDDIVGILHVKDLFDVTDAEEKSFDLSRYLRPAVFVPELKKAGDLFREMRRRRFHMAIVVDELGVISGLVTLEDLIERILGDIADEHDEPAARPVSDGTSLILEGTYRLATLERDLGVSFDEPEAETVAGFLLRKLGRIPRAGARIREGDLEFVVERASQRAIERIRITRRRPAAAEKRKAS
jgi:magnesium and cobalt exporter, CNNM family